MNIKIIAVGKINKNYLQLGINDYLKRLKPYNNIEIIEIKEITTNDLNKNLQEEEKLIINHLKKDDYIISLALEGKMLSSCELANLINKTQTYQTSQIVFVIGGSLGLGKQIKARSDLLLSFGNITYPHQLVRLILLEQLYRASTIIKEQKYHK